MKIDTKDVIAEIHRELKQRERVYPRLIQSGKLHRDRANLQYARLKKAIELIEGNAKALEKQRSLF